jgi:hypothetical protein
MITAEQALSYVLIKLTVYIYMTMPECRNVPYGRIPAHTH